MTEYNLNNTLQTFKSPLFKDQQIRVFGTHDNLMFVAKDICTILGIRNHNDAISSLDEDEKSGVGITDPHGRKQETKVVNESGLYNLIFKSKKEQAKKFRKWVTSEVLPAIRKTGSYRLEQEVKHLKNDMIMVMARSFQQHVGLKRFRNKNVVYIGYIGLNEDMYLFKFGKSENVEQRIQKHKSTFPIFEPVFINEYGSSLLVENSLKRFLQNKGILTTFGSSTEIFGTSDRKDLECVLSYLGDLAKMNEHISRRELQLELIIAKKDHQIAALKNLVNRMKNVLIGLEKKLQQEESEGEYYSMFTCLNCNDLFPTKNEEAIRCNECRHPSP